MSHAGAPSLSRAVHESGIVIIRLAGELDTLGTRQIETAFSTALSNRTVQAVVDLSEVPFITSAALAMFVAHAQTLHRGGGCLCLAAATRIVAEVFERAGFLNIFPIFPTVDDAVACLLHEDECHFLTDWRRGSGASDQNGDEQRTAGDQRPSTMT